MSEDRAERLASTVSTIQARWGERALVAARQAPRQGVIPSGLTALDALLDADREGGAPAGASGDAPRGGFPRGHLSELVGCGTVGHLVAAAGALAQAQRARLHAVYVDVGTQVDVAVLARCGVRLDTLAILRAADLAQGLAMTTDLLRAGFGGLALFDRVHDVRTAGDAEDLEGLRMALRDWAPLLGRSQATFLVLSETAAPGEYADGLPLPYAADLRLLFERRRWLLRREQIVGYVSRVTVLKSRSGIGAGGRAELTITVA